MDLIRICPVQLLVKLQTASKNIVCVCSMKVNTFTLLLSSVLIAREKIA